MENKKILIDLWPAVYSKFCGIAQDTRLNFKLFSQLNNIEPSGLIYSARYESLKKYIQPKNAKQIETESEAFLCGALGKPFNIRELSIKKHFFKIVKFYLQLLTEKKCQLYPIGQNHFDLLWEEILQHGLETTDKELIRKYHYFYSNLTSYHTIYNARKHRDLFLDTKGFDFVYFPQVNPTKVSKNTIKLVRFHDNFPISVPDVTKEEYFKYYILALENCAKDAFFVCDSEVSRQELLILYPELEKRSFVIHCGLTQEYKKIDDANLKLNDIIKKHQSARITKHYPKINEVNFSFILSVGTMEPRKNYLSLLHAWEKINKTIDPDLKLLIIGNPGWKAEKIEKEMRPHIESGQLIHLENLSTQEMATIYSAAKAFVFPSYAEGFGYPPLEAMQCDCPVIASDIPTHREIYGNAALYCDPYNEETLYENIHQLFYSEEHLGLREKLIYSARVRIKDYSLAHLEKYWIELFDRDWKSTGLLP